MRLCSRPKNRKMFSAPSQKSSESARVLKCKLKFKFIENFSFFFEFYSKKEEWNEKVRKSVIHRNPIGSTSEALHRQRTRQSLRRHIMAAGSGLAMDTETLLEFNPKLAEVSHTTRVAYAKFMTTKIKKEISFEDDQVTIENEKSRERGMKAFNKFKTNAGILKRFEALKSDSSGSGTSSDEVKLDDFRSRTPIEEDPNEDIQTPELSSTPENIIDEPVPAISSSPPLPTSQITPPSPAISDVSRKPDSPMVKTRSMSINSEQSAKSPEPPKTELSKTDEDDESEDEDTDSNQVTSTASTHLSVPSPASNRPIKSINSGEKGKSKITGKTLTGWI